MTLLGDSYLRAIRGIFLQSLYTAEQRCAVAGKEMDTGNQGNILVFPDFFQISTLDALMSPYSFEMRSSMGLKMGVAQSYDTPLGYVCLVVLHLYKNKCIDILLILYEHLISNA